MTHPPLIVGVLALQGAFAEHINHFSRAGGEGFEFIEVRTKEQLNRCHGLVIPGGESTSISLIAERTGLLPELYKFIADESKLVWGTCAGLIFLSKQILNGKPEQKLLGGLNITVTRNAFGRQLDSFSQDLDFSSFIPGGEAFPTIFIRAPVVASTKLVLTDEPMVVSENTYDNPYPVEVLHALDNGFIVAVKQGNKLGTSFHPELAPDYRFHKWFLDTLKEKCVPMA